MIINHVKIYKTIDKKPAIYIETNGLAAPLDIEIYLDYNLVYSVRKENYHHIFNVTKSGVYSVVARQGDSSHFRSNSLPIHESDLQPENPGKSPAPQKPFSISDADPKLDEIDEFYIEIKVKKENINSIKRILDSVPMPRKVQRKVFDLSSFPETHSIHGYEYYRIFNIPRKEDALNVCRKFDGVKGVAYCSIVPVTDNLPPPKKQNAIEKSRRSVSDAPDTPDFSDMQGYLDEHHGMNVRNAWAKGCSGESATIRHMDFGIYRNHEDFQEGNITVVNSRDETADCNHGTASTGCIAAGENGSGVTGIAHSSLFYFYDTGDKDIILEQANPGDIVSLDIQFLSNGVYIPAIAVRGWWDTICNLSEKGAIVIMAAGNSGIDLSDPSICPDYGDSGAMLVGACASSTGRRHQFSNHGHYSSVINSWGDNVATTGYGSLQDLPGHDRDYTNTYSGTSSATPLCAGALALLQSYAKKQGIILTPNSMKELVSESEYTEGVDDLIGKRPNVEQLLTRIDKLALSPIGQGNPFPVSSNYINHNVFFSLDSDCEVQISFDYRFSDITNAGIVAYYDSEGPASLEWYRYGHSQVKIPVVDADDQISTIYMRISKVVTAAASSEFTMNSAADLRDRSPGSFDLALKLLIEDNKYLPRGKYKGILPLYVKSWNFPDYNLPVRLNIFIE